ncbi:MAG: hypothetical protein HN884_02650 [Rhodospirillaceae bacterium]|jgi:hypothetical protein|nr:hypothetical protein [Rhodospirillaceae bacterium]MBT7265748.1 hypothetical protein [Rhodospirillaceae bacterium]
MRYDVFVTVWGQDFVTKYLEFSLASQLMPGNLPALAAEADIHYHIYTDRASRDYFGSSIKKLAEFAEVHFHNYDEIAYGGGNLQQAIENSDPSTVKHNVQRITAQHMLSALEKGAAAILLDSDFIIADGSLARLHDLRLAGKRAVMALFMRLNEATAAPILRQDLSAHMAPRDLVRLSLDHMHPIFGAYFMGGASSTHYPSQLNWRVEQFGEGAPETAGVISQCLFPHPLMVIPDKTASESGSKYFSTMDYDFALRAVSDDAAIHLSRSSDEILICKISPESYLADGEQGEPLSIERMAHFVLNNTNIRHRLFLDQSICFVANEGGNWDDVNQDAQRFMEATYKAVELMVGQLPKGDPKTMVHLKSFLGPIEDFLSPQVQSKIKGWLPK